MYIEPWIFWVCIIGISLCIAYINWRLSEIEGKMRKILEDDGPLYKQNLSLNKRITELENWLDFLHQDKDEKEMEKFKSWESQLETTKTWCKAKKMTTEETKNYIKNYKKTWGKRYDEAHKNEE